MQAPVSGRSGRVPAYRRQREKGRPDRAVCTISGKRHVLGVWNSPESRQRYAELLAAPPEPATPPPPPPSPSADPTMAELMAAYLRHAVELYGGDRATEVVHFRSVFRILRRQWDSMLGRNFGPKAYKAVREAMIESDWSRSYVGDQCGRLKRFIAWCVEEELLPESAHHALKAVRPLRRGHSAARETAPVCAVSLEAVEATAKHLPEVVADMVRLQLLTGMRPGELVQLRPCDVDRSGEVWWFTPPTHKTKHLGKRRAVALGPQAQAVLVSYLARGAEMNCFRPCDSEAKRRAERSESRKTPLSCGNRPGTNRVAQPRRCAGERYTTVSYRRAIARAAAKAGVESWHPHQLRHTAATVARREFTLDHVQALLGHSHAAITEVYAELDRAKAAEVARRLG